ncbi:MAG: hypothetical protein RLZZ44_32, partial [Bacteroidota bacterium]
SSTDYASFTVTGTAATIATDSVSVTILQKTIPAVTGAVAIVPTVFLLETSTTYAVETRVDTLAINSARGAAADAYVQRTSLAVAAAGGIDTMTTAGQFRIFPVTAGGFYAKFGVAIDSGTTRKAGTYTYQVGVTYPSTNSVNTTTYYDISLVVSAAASASTVASAVYSTAYLQQTASASVATGVTTDSVVAIPSYAQANTTDSASIVLTLKNASNVAAAAESVTVTTTLGLVQPTGGASQGKSLVLAYTAGTPLKIGIKGDGTAGVATITISTASVSYTKQVTLYSTSVATITGTKRLNTLQVGSNAAAVTAVAKDSLGNQNGLDTVVYAYSSDTTIVSNYGTACSYSVANARQECSLTGVIPGTATITLRNASTVATSTISDATTYSVTVSNAAPATLVLSLDKASYAPGEKGYLFISANDASGKPVYPQTITNLIAATGLTTNAQLGASSDTLTGYTTTSGVSLALAQKSALTGRASLEPVFQFVFYAPNVGSSLTFTATGGTGLPTAGQVAVTATAKISNEANDNASAALAAVTALASQVSAFITKINAQITTLTDLVMKIQKKVKA